MSTVNIYFGHSKDINYEELYRIIESKKRFNNYNFILPHKKDKNSRNGRVFYTKDNIDLFIAEVSRPSTGLGIEMGWAYVEDIPVYAMYKKDFSPSGAIRSVTDKFIEYDNLEDFVIKLDEIISKFSN